MQGSSVAQNEHTSTGKQFLFRVRDLLAPYDYYYNITWKAIPEECAEKRIEWNIFKGIIYMYILN